jgi:hypothetical protein
MFKLGNITCGTWKPHYLIKINLSNCPSVTTLLEGLETLISLTTLDLWGCSSLTTQTKGLRNLTLRELEFKYCSSLKTSIDAFGNLITMTHASFVWMLKVDNITQGTWKPHFFDASLFGKLLKLDNITKGN